VPLAAFRGQMAAIYLFDAALSAGGSPGKVGTPSAMSCLSFDHKGCCATCLLLSSCRNKVHYRASQNHYCRPSLLQTTVAEQTRRAAGSHTALLRAMCLLLGNSSCMWTMHCRQSGGAARAGARLPVRLLCCGVLRGAGAGRPCGGGCAGGARCAWPTAAGGLQCPGAEPPSNLKSHICGVCACSGVVMFSMAHDHSAELEPRPCVPCTKLKNVRTATSGPCAGCCNLIGARPDAGYHNCQYPLQAAAGRALFDTAVMDRSASAAGGGGGGAASAALLERTQVGPAARLQLQQSCDAVPYLLSIA
jgi:hypothetical protein